MMKYILISALLLSHLCFAATKPISFNDKQQAKKVAKTLVDAQTNDELHDKAISKKAISLKVAVLLDSVRNMKFTTSETAKNSSKKDGYFLFPCNNDLPTDFLAILKNIENNITIVYENKDSRKFKMFTKFLASQKKNNDDMYVICYVTLTKETFDPMRALGKQGLFCAYNCRSYDSPTYTYLLDDWCSCEVYEAVKAQTSK